jgi:crotonobetainyl-CoA:carnitine CoA-transferase CaiB-like acyl-CoA transferase
VEIATGVAGDYCGRLLAGLGAEVVKLEPDGGDPVRLYGPFPGDVPDRETGALHLHLNAGKESASFNHERLHALLPGASVLLASHQRRDLEALQLDLAGLARQYPALVIANITPFGMTGPYADYRGGELVCYALGGYAMLTGERDRRPLKAYGELANYQAGAHAALGILAALRARDRQGAGQTVDVSVMEAATFLLGGAEQQAFFYGRAARRNGARLVGFPPHHSYPSTIRPCKDGYVHVHSNNRHADLMAALIGNPRLNAPDLLHEQLGHADEIDTIVDEWLATRSRDEAVSEAQSMRLPFTEVRTPGEVLREPHYRERQSFVTIDHPAGGRRLQPGAPIRMSATPWRDLPAPALGQHSADVTAGRWAAEQFTPAGRAGERPLAGVRVLDFTNAVAGPLSTSMLALLGADVIKVEPPNGRPRGSAGSAPRKDGSDERPWDRVLLFNAFNHGKRSLVLDAAKPAGREVFLGLAAQSDIVVQNFAPRVMGNLGLGYDDLRSVNPDIILVSMPAFGLSGPYRDRGSYGPGIDAMSGLSHLTGYADGPPSKPGNFFCDQNAAVLAAYATLAALRHKEATGEGQHVELAMIEGEFQLLADAYAESLLNGREPMRAGNDHRGFAPHDTFPCLGEDAWVAIGVDDDAQFAALCGVIGRPELADDPRFATASARFANRHELEGPIAAWTRGRTVYEAQAALQQVGVPAGAVLDAVQLLSDPHVVARHGFEYVETGGVGPTPYPRPAFQLSGTPVPLERPGPEFGDANSFVLRDLLGLGEEQIARLYADGIVASEPVAAGARQEAASGRR